jgi:hypothetical protein
MSAKKINGPGQRLFDVIKNIYSPSAISVSLVENIDADTGSEGLFSQHVYDRCIVYMMRRILTSCTYFLNKNGVDIEDIGAANIDLARRVVTTYLISNAKKLTGEKNIEDVIIECLRISKKDFTSYQFQKAVEGCGENLKCYIAGEELDIGSKIHGRMTFGSKIAKEIEVDGVDMATIRQAIKDHNQKARSHNNKLPECDHVWPRSLGGLTDLENGRIACAVCNESKNDILSSADARWDEIMTKHLESSDEFKKDIGTHAILAISLRQGHQCWHAEISQNK